MPIIGQLIKTAIELKEKLSFSDNPADDQEELLINLLDKAAKTSFGTYYHFEDILESKHIQSRFREVVPYHDYNQMYDRWWKQTVQDVPNITWPGESRYFALSSGTTGDKSKRIPVSDEMLEAIRGTAIDQITAMANFDLPPNFYESEILMLGSSTDLKKVGKHLEGEISGISASNIPNWFEGSYRPGKEISVIEDWEERILKIAEEAPNWDIGALSGIPAWIELMLKKIIEVHKLENIHQIWPNLQVYTSGGVAFEPYRKGFNQLLANPIHVVDTYLASEGFLGYQSRPDTSTMKLALNNGIYFEFVPFQADAILDDGSLSPTAPSLSLGEIENDREYVLVISTVSGAWRYMIGDTIKFTDKNIFEFVITGRTKHFLNVVGEQLSVLKINEAVQALDQEHNIEVKEFTLGTLKDDKNNYYHQWYIGCENRINEEICSDHLDKTLQESNKAYRVSRTKALSSVKVKLVPNDLFYQWSEKTKKKGGQIKTPRVMQENELLEFAEFVEERGRRK